MATKEKLTPKQERFIASYLANGLNAKQAAISAGYSESRAEITGSDLVRNRKVAAAIAEGSRKVLTKLDISAERVLNELGRLAFFDPLNLFEDDGSVKRLSLIDPDTRACIASLDVAELFEGGDGSQKHAYGLLKRVKLADKLAALDKLARYHSLFKEKDETEKPLTVIVNI